MQALGHRCRPGEQVVAVGIRHHIAVASAAPHLHEPGRPAGRFNRETRRPAEARGSTGRPASTALVAS
jgi:hypothetical protein